MVHRTLSVFGRRPPTSSLVFASYWRFASPRQQIYHRRVRGEPGPWTTDPIPKDHRFANAYRTAHRVSQFMIRNVAYDGDHTPNEGIGTRIRIKQRFRPLPTAVDVWFPPKWGINDDLPGVNRPNDRPQSSFPQDLPGRSRLVRVDVYDLRADSQRRR